MFSKEEELEYEELKRKLAIYDAMKRIERDRIALRDQELDDVESAKEKIRKEGRKQIMEKIARNLLKAGCEIDLIIEATGLSKEQIENLKD